VKEKAYDVWDINETPTKKGDVALSLGTHNNPKKD